MNSILNGTTQSGQNSQFILSWLLRVIVQEYKPLVWKIVRDVISNMQIYENNVLEMWDYYMAGVTGFIEALGRYDPSKGTRLTSFTSPRIAGAIIDELRKLDILTRGERERVNIFNKIRQSPYSKIGMEMGEQEMANEIGISVMELRDIIALATTKEISINKNLPFADEDDKPIRLEDSLEVFNALDDYRARTPYDDIYYKERGNDLVSALNSLPEKEKIVFEAYYLRNMTQGEIAISGILGRKYNPISVNKILANARKRFVQIVAIADGELEGLVIRAFEQYISFHGGQYRPTIMPEGLESDLI